jgi:ATP-dependent Zn protease
MKGSIAVLLRIAEALDMAPSQLLAEAESRAEGILVGNREALERVAQALLAEEVLDEARIEAIIGHPKRSDEAPAAEAQPPA